MAFRETSREMTKNEFKISKKIKREGKKKKQKKKKARRRHE